MMTTILILILIMQACILYLLLAKRNKHDEKTTIEKGNTPKVKNTDAIVGKSSFVLTQNKNAIPVVDTSGKMDIEVSLEYEADIDPIEEQEELEQHGIPLEFASHISFEDMIEVVNDVDCEQPKNPEKTGKLLYENDTADWVIQMESTADVFQKRIVGLIDLHLDKIKQPESEVSDDDVENFDIGAFWG